MSVCMVFQIEARETLTMPMMAGSATVVINIVDENDNSPMFSQPSYDLMIREDQTGGVILRTITVHILISTPHSQASATSISVSCMHSSYFR